MRAKLIFFGTECSSFLKCSQLYINRTVSTMYFVNNIVNFTRIKKFYPSDQNYFKPRIHFDIPSKNIGSFQLTFFNKLRR
jgi:hypothetical protein